MPADPTHGAAPWSTNVKLDASASLGVAGPRALVARGPPPRHPARHGGPVAHVIRAEAPLEPRLLDEEKVEVVESHEQAEPAGEPRRLEEQGLASQHPGHPADHRIPDVAVRAHGDEASGRV